MQLRRHQAAGLSLSALGSDSLRTGRRRLRVPGFADYAEASAATSFFDSPENVSGTLWHSRFVINDLPKVKSFFANVKSHLTITKWHLTNDESHLISPKGLLAAVVSFFEATKFYITFVNSLFVEAKSDIADTLSLLTFAAFDLAREKSFARFEMSLFAVVKLFVAKIQPLLTNIDWLTSFTNSVFTDSECSLT